MGGERMQQKKEIACTQSSYIQLGTEVTAAVRLGEWP